MCVSPGDLRGDNFFFDNEGDGWAAIDFQLAFKGPVPTDLAYLMSSGTVLPEVYEGGLDEVLHCFYDEFQKHTKAYTSATYSFEQFEKEFYRMTHVVTAYVTALIYVSSFLDDRRIYRS